MKSLANYVTANKFKNCGVFGIGSKQLLFDDLDEWGVLVSVASLWLQESTKEQIIMKTVEKYPTFTKEKVEEACKTLEENNFVIDSSFLSSVGDKAMERYSRSNAYHRLVGADPEIVQTKLSQSTVAVVGCGGIGNYISYMLATSGVGEIVLVDDDEIELSNLTRQFLFCESDIGQKKIDVIERELQKRNKTTKIIKSGLNINSVEDFYKIKQEIDLFVLSADTPQEIIQWMNCYAVKEKIPYINIGYMNDISVVGPFFIPGKTACFECAQVIPNPVDSDDPYTDECKQINSKYKAPTFPPVNGTSASIAMNDILRYLGGYGEIFSANKRIGIHSLEIKIETQEIVKSKDCKICGHL